MLQVKSSLLQNFGISLCINDKDRIKDMSTFTTEETIILYFALKHRNAPSILEKFDGFKHIEIAIPDKKTLNPLSVKVFIGGSTNGIQE